MCIRMIDNEKLILMYWCLKRRVIMGAINERLGSRIKQLRELKGLSQKDVARKLGVNRASISQIESGDRKVSAEELLKLSKLFNLTPNNLLNLEKEPEVILKESKEEKKEIKPEKGERIAVPQKNLEKFKEVLIYILNKVGSKANVGETVIYKLLYFIDFDYYEKYEEQLIGATYIKNTFGPTPVEFAKIVDKMIRDKEIVKVNDKYYNYPRTKYLPTREANIDILKPREIKLIDNVLNSHSDKNATEISEYSHADVPWLTTNDGEKIEYESVFYRTPPYSVRQKIEDRGML